jgi:hypothetical protein
MKGARMASTNAVRCPDGLSLRHAALIAGLGYLLTPTSYAEYGIWPRLVIPGNIGQTILNISAHQGRFVVAILCYLVSFLLDIVIAWALYLLLAPVNRALSLLTACFRLVYATAAIVATLNLVHVFRLVQAPDYAAAFGIGPLQAQVKFSLDSFHWDFSASLIIFAIHLVLLGILIFRSAYIPRLIGVLLIVDGLGWAVSSLHPYLYPSLHLGWIFITYFGELVFMLWLLIRGWKIPEPAPAG